MKKTILISIVSLIAYTSYSQNTRLKYSEMTPYQKVELECCLVIGGELGLDTVSLRGMCRQGNIDEAVNTILRKVKTAPSSKREELNQKIAPFKEEMERVKIEKDFYREAEETKGTSDYRKVNLATFDFYRNWAPKSEFEKASEYEQRMANEQEELGIFISESIFDITVAPIETTILKYDPEAERMFLKFSNKHNAIWLGYIDNVKGEEARSIKEQGILYMKPTTSVTEQDTVPYMFCYYNLVPAKIYEFARHKVTITKYPYGLNNGSQILTKEKIVIDTRSFTSYNIEKIRYYLKLRDQRIINKSRH